MSLPLRSICRMETTETALFPFGDIRRTLALSSWSNIPATAVNNHGRFIHLVDGSERCPGRTQRTEATSMEMGFGTKHPSRQENPTATVRHSVNPRGHARARERRV